MSVSHRRMIREKKTIKAMVRIYCESHHQTHHGLCPECSELLEYAMKRIDKCPFQENKTTCAKCPVHCYKPYMRERVKSVMRFSGPRMSWKHPVLALFHFIDGMKRRPGSTS